MVEFRLYYDDNGRVLCYTCEALEGNYIIIDRQTYAECRPDIKVVDGKIVKVNESAVIAKLTPSNEGTWCAKDDVSIIVDESYEEKQRWETKLNEFRYY